MDLAVPNVRIEPRSSRGKLGHFTSAEAFAHYLDAYRGGMAELPPFSARFDVPTAFGTVRVYRFDGPGGGRPVVALPGRNASTPMWRANVSTLLQHRTVYCADLLGEAGLSVQRRPITGAADHAQWLDETLAGLEFDSAHLIGVSFGGWTSTNCAVHRPARVASLALLDPVLTFAPIPVQTMLASIAMFAPKVPESLRRRVLSWISGGGDLDEADMEAQLISAGSTDFNLRTPVPRRFSDTALRGLDMPVLAVIAGRSVMLNADRAAAQARKVLRHGQVELWPEASHAVNGEYPDEIAQLTGKFWDHAEAVG